MWSPLGKWILRHRLDPVRSDSKQGNCLRHRGLIGHHKRGGPVPDFLGEHTRSGQGGKPVRNIGLVPATVPCMNNLAAKKGCPCRRQKLIQSSIVGQRQHVPKCPEALVRFPRIHIPGIAMDCGNPLLHRGLHVTLVDVHDHDLASLAHQFGGKGSSHPVRPHDQPTFGRRTVQPQPLCHPSGGKPLNNNGTTDHGIRKHLK
ncbi:MAG: hypothetical protein BWY82_00538 [Verrucomicrobia bacterium ADurb.Bin474]|nr:MAG: hypothetical protein BWY82_00538 [Verrucomicrobia bacterium ADurb.Bin474]